MSNELDKILGHIKDLDTKQTIKSFFDSLFVVMEKNIPYCTDFMSPIEIKYAISLMNTFGFDRYLVYPSLKECERNVLLIFGEYYEPDPEEYIKTLSFEIPDKDIVHRDVLGSLLSLGISRSKVGDILFTKTNVVLFIRNTIENYILNNFFKVRNQNISIEEISDFNFEDVKKNYVKETMIVSSLRLDTICSGLMKSSRKKASDKITKGEVKLNYVEEKSTHQLVEDFSVISIRGYGRYRFLEPLSRTKKDNYVVEFLKYI